MTPHKEIAEAMRPVIEAERKVEEAANALYVAEQDLIAKRRDFKQSWAKYNERICSEK